MQLALGFTILLVDEDEATAGHICAAILADRTFQVHHVKSVEAAERVLKKNHFAIILLSLTAPDFPGLAAVALIQAVAAKTPLIVIAKEADEPTALKALQQGATDYLIRPQIYDTVLLRTIKHGIEVRRAQEQKEEMERELKWERDFSTALVDTAGCLFMVLDRAGRIVQFNNTCEEITGYSSEEVRGRRAWDFMLLSHEKAVVIEAFRTLVSGVYPASYEHHLVARDRSDHLIAWSSTVLTDNHGDVEYVVTTGIEITERKAAERALRMSEARYRELFEQSRDAIFLTDPDGRISEANRALVDLLGYTSQELQQKPIDNFFVDGPDPLILLQEQAARGSVNDLEVRIRTRDGRILWCLMSLVERQIANGFMPGYQGIIHDITDRKRAEERLLYSAYHDVLTGLANRALFTDRLERALARWRRHPEHRFAVLFVDLNRFKVVNDSLGHSAGDELLRKVGEIIYECLREQDTVARLGGDEFGILVDYVESEAEAVLVAERIHMRLDSPVVVGGQNVFTSCSIGIALVDQDSSQPEDMLRNADIAMYRAKAEGPARFALYTQGMHSVALTLMELDMELHEAVRNKEFVLHYQPIYSLDDRQIRGFEALLRWKNPKRGLLMPAEFLELAEETGLILPIGRWVMRQACEQIANWQRAHPHKPMPFVSMNISSRQLAQPNFVAETTAILRATGVDPSRLMLELTETSLLQNPESCAATITKLRAIGVAFCIDDFGTGYSSLSYLHRLPISGLKIDRSFIAGLDRGEGPELVSTIVSLAHNLGIYAVAEGVETEAQLRSVQALGPAYVQGYFLSLPVDAEAAESMVV